MLWLENVAIAAFFVGMLLISWGIASFIFTPQTESAWKPFRTTVIGAILLAVGAKFLKLW